MAVNINKKSKPKQRRSAPPSVISLNYSLAELPTSQHRAGLAGLVLMIRWLTEQERINGICEFTRIDDQGATIQLDEPGLKTLFAETYDFIEGERESEKLRTRTKSKKVIQPKRTIEKINESGEKTPVHIYPTFTPKGAFLATLDPTADNAGKGLWVDLWREFVWNVIRKKDRSKEIYRNRNTATREGVKVWKSLVTEATSSAEPSALSGTDLIGARAHNAEQVQFKDITRQKLLLNFWSYTTQVYIPIRTVVDKKTKEPKAEELGYALAVPEVARLETFCRVLPAALLTNRGSEKWKWHPRDSVIDVPAESALDYFLKLSSQLSLQESALGMSRVVTAIDVFHVDPSGQDVSIRGTARIEPESFRPDEYERIRRGLFNHEFRKQRILNILNEREWYADFDSLLTRLPLKLGFDDKKFSQDAHESFKNEVTDLEVKKPMRKEDSPFGTETVNNDEVEAIRSSSSESRSTESLIYGMIGRYLDRKLKARRDFDYSDVKAGTADKDEYSKERRKLAMDAFYAVKSRTGADFVEYFANTLCSISQSMSEQDYVILAHDLHKNPETIRTLTILALSARS